MKDLNPPAIVRPVQDIAELWLSAKEYVQRIDYNKRTILSDAAQLGRILSKLKKAVGRGNWLKKLKDRGFTHQRASEWMRVGKLPNPALSQCSSVEEALEKAAELRLTEEDEESESLNQSTIWPDNEYSYGDPEIRPEANGKASVPHPPNAETASKPHQRKPPKLPRGRRKRPEGGYCGHVVTGCFGSLRRHTGHMYKEAGLVDVDGWPAVDPWLENWWRDVDAMEQRIKARRKELKAKKK
jgi:hypothetical protein